MIGLGALLWLLLSPGVQLQTSSVFASPLSTPISRPNITYWGLHLGNHVHGEPWTADLLQHIDGDQPAGLWPSVIVFPSFNLYEVNRNESGDCKILSINGKYDLMTGTGTPLGYLQRASAAGVRIFIRIWPSPGNFDTDHRLSLLPQPFNGNRCDDGSSGQGGNRSYDDIGDEIIQIHQWNASHGITETGFFPANEPNAEWYNFNGPVQRNQVLAWTDMDAYFTAVYTHVHAILPYPAVSVFTPPMSQEAYAELRDFNGCVNRPLIDDPQSHGYEKMPNVFLYGTHNDGYAWNNYWNLGYEPWTPNCDKDVTPHGHHVSLWFPVQMINHMLTKPTIITEADLKSPMQTNNDLPTVADKDDQLGATAATSIEQFELAEGTAEDIAVWALNITNPDETEQNWHEAYACNDLNWTTGQNKGPALERPWFTRLWLGETPTYQVTPCYRIFLAGITNNYPEELIKNGHFDLDTSYWTVSRTNCPYPLIQTYTDTLTSLNYAAVLGVCQLNVDTLSQSVTLPANATSAQLSYKYQLKTGYYGGSPTAYLNVLLVDGSGTHTLDTYDDSGNNPHSNVWQSITIDLRPYAGQTVQLKFQASNSLIWWPASFWIDDVSLIVAH